MSMCCSCCGEGLVRRDGARDLCTQLTTERPSVNDLHSVAAGAGAEAVTAACKCYTTANKGHCRTMGAATSAHTTATVVS
jgi:hypothetical protein